MPNPVQNRFKHIFVHRHIGIETVRFRGSKPLLRSWSLDRGSVLRFQTLLSSHVAIKLDYEKRLSPVGQSYCYSG